MLRCTIASLALCACGGADEDLLENGPSVGTACNVGGAMLSEVPVGTASSVVRAYADLRGSRTAIWLLPQGNLSVTRCELSFDGSETPWRLTVEAQQLGTFTVQSGDVSIFTPPTQTAASGMVTLAGYAAPAALCGSVDLTMAGGGRLRGTFSAEVFCE